MFTQPKTKPNIPATIKRYIDTVDAKLLEVVSLTELSKYFYEQNFRLYRLDYSEQDPIHCAPIYQYFLPEQAYPCNKNIVQCHWIASSTNLIRLRITCF